MRTIQQRFIYLREVHELKQQDVAKALGVSRSAYANYESGFRTPDIGTLIKLADFYGISLDELVGHGSAGAVIPELSPTEGTMLRLFRQLSPAGQERLTRQAAFEIEWEAAHPPAALPDAAHKK